MHLALPGDESLYLSPMYGVKIMKKTVYTILADSCVSAHTLTLAHTHAYTHMHIHMHTHTHTHALHAHLHTHMERQSVTTGQSAEHDCTTQPHAH